MRRSVHQREVIRNATAEVAGPLARVLLFESRTRPDLRCGDIDLPIELAQARPTAELVTSRRPRCRPALRQSNIDQRI